MIECGNTLELEEDLRYTRESNKYGYIKNIQMANKIQIANIKYNGRYGNIKNSNDGWNFRDRGLIQLTGRYNYQDFTIKARELMWIDNTINFEKNPNLICENGKYAIMSAAYFWVNKKCFEKAKNTNNESIDAITNIINKHTDSYKIRQEQYQRIKNTNIFKNFI